MHYGEGGEIGVFRMIDEEALAKADDSCQGNITLKLSTVSISYWMLGPDTARSRPCHCNLTLTRAEESYSGRSWTSNSQEQQSQRR